MSVKISELPVLAPGDVAAGDVVPIVDESEGVTKRVDLVELINVFVSDPFALKAIAEPFAVWDHIAGVNVPDNSGTAKYIRLTAGQSGAGGYNVGLLTDEQVSGSAPLVEADAEIATGPLAGQRVPLINTEGAFIRPGTDSGALQFDQMQKLTGSMQGRVSNTAGDNNFFDHTGVLSESGSIITGTGSTGEINTGTGRTRREGFVFDSADSPDARVSDTTDGETRPKNRQATYYMRIV